MDIPHFLYLFIYWWAFRLLPPLDYCIQCCNEYGCANISSRSCFQLFCVYTKKWVCWIICVLSASVCNPMDCHPPDSSVHGIFQARILEWVAISFSRGCSQPRDWTCVSKVSCIGRQILYHWATWEAPDHMVTLLLIIGANPILFTIPAKLFFSSVQPLSCVWLFATPWTAARQASLSITNSQSLRKLMSIKSVMPSN